MTAFPTVENISRARPSEFAYHDPGVDGEQDLHESFIPSKKAFVMTSMDW